MKLVTGLIIYFSLTTFVFINREIKEIRVSSKFVKDCETGKGPCDPIKATIKRNETVLVHLPSGGTETKILISGPGNVSDSLMGDCDAVFDYNITEPGRYSFSYLSCGLGGSFILEVTQED